MNETEEHRRCLSDHFSALTSYWRDIYTSSVNSWDFFHQVAVIKRKEAVLDWVERYAQGKSMQILDGGCGAGSIMEALLRSGHQVSGIDISADMLRETSNNLGEIGLGDTVLRVGSVEALDFPDKNFDVSLCIGVLQYLQDDELALKELARVTKAGGMVIISLPNMARVTTLCDPYYYLCRLPPFIIYRILGFKRADSKLTSDDISRNRTFRNRRYYYGQLRKLYKRYGLKVRAIVPIGYGPLTFWMREYLPRMMILRGARGIERLSSSRTFSFLKAIADRWVVVLQKDIPEVTH